MTVPRHCCVNDVMVRLRHRANKRVRKVATAVQRLATDILIMYDSYCLCYGAFKGGDKCAKIWRNKEKLTSLPESRTVR